MTEIEKIVTYNGQFILCSNTLAAEITGELIIIKYSKYIEIRFKGTTKHNHFIDIWFDRIIYDNLANSIVIGTLDKDGEKISFEGIVPC